MSQIANRTTSEDGSARYDHPVKKTPDGKPEWFLSITTALQSVAKDALKHWAAKGAAQRAMDELPKLIGASLVAACGRTTTAQRCGDCIECMVRWVAGWHFAESNKAKARGSAVHDVIEAWSLTGAWISYDTEIAPYVETFKRFIADYGLAPTSWELTETTLLNRAEGCAGTTDGAIRFRSTASPAARVLVAKIYEVAGQPMPDEQLDQGVECLALVDFKTRAKPAYFYTDEWALQLAGYSMCPVVMLKDGTELPAPDTQGGVVVQIRPNGYRVWVVDTSDDAYAQFLGAMNLYRWLRQPLATKARLLPEVGQPSGGTDEAAPVAAVATKTPGPAISLPRERKATKSPGRTAASARQATATKQAVRGGRDLPQRVLGDGHSSNDSIPF